MAKPGKSPTTYQFARSRVVQTVERIITEGREEGMIWHNSKDSFGRFLEKDGKTLLNFASCSYLSLHLHDDLKAGAISAIERFGTQFSISRMYYQCQLYTDLELGLGRMTGGHVLVTPSTSLAHQAALPVLVGDDDLAIIDQFAHASLHVATKLLASTPVIRLRHSSMEQLESYLIEHGSKYLKIWYICDGLYSMRGDFAPFAHLARLQAMYPQLHLYVDDAHAVGWYGCNGRGAALEHLPQSDRTVVALSLNKSFSAAGGALVFSRQELKDRVHMCGGPLIFSGPVQPPMLGAAVAAAHLHLSPELARMQAELTQRILYARELAEQVGVRFISQDATPIFFLPHDSPQWARAAARAFWSEGIYVCPVNFPAVPVNMPGIRFSITRHNEFSDIDRFMEIALRLQPG